MLVSTAPREGGLSWSIWLLLFFLATKIFTLMPMDFRRPNFSQAPLLSAFCCLPRSSWFWSEKLEKLHSLSVTLPTKSKLHSRLASHSHQQLPSRHKQVRAERKKPYVWYWVLRILFPTINNNLKQQNEHASSANSIIYYLFIFETQDQVEGKEFIFLGPEQYLNFRQQLIYIKHYSKSGTHL